MCGHNRQKLDDATLLPCAHPGCPDGMGNTTLLVVQTPTGERQFCLQAVPQRLPGGVVRRHYSWREA